MNIDEAGPVDEPPRDIDRHTFAVTFFPDIAAKTIIDIVNPTLPQLAEAIRCTTNVDKMALPWLKMATFGNERSKYGCLRTNKNLIEISGVEGDHDSGELAFDAAVEIMRKAHIRCLLYTSASFVPVTKERWRILVPLSKPYPPSSRREMVAEINGLLGGVLAGESFTLSLSYLFGSVNNNPDHRVEVIDGMFLDHCPGLLPGAIFKDGSRGVEGLTGVKPRHIASVNHTPPGPVERSKVEAALALVSSNCKYEVWLKIAGALYHQFGDDGFELFDDWSIKADGFIAKSDGTPMYTSEKTEARWEGARTMTDVTIGTLFHHADKADPTWRRRYEDAERQRIWEGVAPVIRALRNAGTGAGANSGAGSGTGAGAGASDSPSGAPRPNLSATPYEWIEPADITPRDWLYGRLLVRKFVTATVAPGGLGKSSLIAAEAVAQVSGMDLIGVRPKERLRVWLWNLEDPQEETQRKIQAVAKHYGLGREAIGNRLFVDSGRDQSLVVAKMTREGPTIARPVVDALVKEIIDNQIDVLIIDPFVSCHEVPENDNTAQDMVVKEWGKVAELGNCAVHLVDHTRKMGSSEAEVTTETARGAKAKTDACRVVRAVSRMTKDEGERAGVENHRLYFRTYNDKANLAPPADKSDWFELKSVDLDNGPGMEVGGVRFNAPGDSVGVVKCWEWPDPLAGMTGQDFEKVAAVIRRGKWRENAQAKAWVGHAVAEALGMDATNKSDRARIGGMLKIWLKVGSLVVVERPDDFRSMKKFVEVKEDDA